MQSSLPITIVLLFLLLCSPNRCYLCRLPCTKSHLLSLNAHSTLTFIIFYDDAEIPFQLFRRVVLFFSLICLLTMYSNAHTSIYTWWKSTQTAAAT